MKGSVKRERKDVNGGADTTVKTFLDGIMENIEATQRWTPLERQLFLLAQSPDYVMLLRRAWCYQEMAREDPVETDEARARRLGSKADVPETSSLYKQARILHTLLVDLELHKLRYWCPTKLMFSQLVHHARDIERYIRDTCPEEADRWIDDDFPTDGYLPLTWYVQPQFQ